MPRPLKPEARARGVTAILGPTNTGKTHLAIERMLGHDSGLIGLPLRLLAREVYQRVVDRVGPQSVALVTGEEKIKPPGAKYWIATVEAMPRDIAPSFVAIDEIQLCADLDRGHIFTERLLNMRGRAETLLIGASTMKPLIEKLLPGVNIVTRPRLSQLSFAGSRKITRLPPRSAIVAFSAEEVYAIAELIRRQRGGAAVVLGALSPRTRNAQVALYQSREVDYLVATDAIGMGLNLDVEHVAFASERKFDGVRHRRLYPAEFAQIAGRAGRYLTDGTFGTSGRCEPFEEELVEALEAHRFDPFLLLQWRNAHLDFSSIARLIASLERPSEEEGLIKAPVADDLHSLELVARDEDIRDMARGHEKVERLWDVCQVPDYRKVSPMAHADLVATIFRSLMQKGHVSDDWFSARIREVERTDGDIAMLSQRIAQVRTWTYVANRPDWLKDPEHWQGVARQVEDTLSDALHERLTQRFVDRRTSVLLRRLRENAMLEAEIGTTGDVLVEGQHVGQLHGFQFTPDPQAGGPEAKALRLAAQKALAGEYESRATRVSNAVDDAFALGRDGALRFLGEVVAKLTASGKIFEPRLQILADEGLTGPALEKVEARLTLWLKTHIDKLLGPLLKLEAGDGLEGTARGLAFQIAEALGVLERNKVAEEVRGLSQDDRAKLRASGVRFGAYHLTVPALLKPAPRGLAAQLWALSHGGPEPKGLDDILHLAASGRTSIPVDKEVEKGLYRAAGFRVCGERAVRVDILERLADLIRPAIQYRPGVTPGEPPAGTADGEGFVVTPAMTSLCGCAGEDFASILKSLGYVADKRQGPAITVALVAVAATVPAETVSTESVPETPEATPAPESTVSDTPAPANMVEPTAPAETAAIVSTEVTEPTEATTETPAEVASAEPVLIEVWRQGRRQQGGGRPQHRRPDQHRNKGARPAEGATDGQSADNRPRRERPHWKKPEGEGQDQRGPRPPRPDRDKRHGGKPGGRPQGGKPGGKPDFRQERPVREKQPDPNSPFAKLLALKAELEGKK
jgi:ATP-dependent RNA helicase SUPV3L1/SUV3